MRVSFRAVQPLMAAGNLRFLPALRQRCICVRFLRSGRTGRLAGTGCYALAKSLGGGNLAAETAEASDHEGGPGVRARWSRARGMRVRGSGGSGAVSPAPAAALCWLARDDAWQRGNHASVGQEFAAVVEEHDSVAEQAPALLRMGGYRSGGVPVGGRRGRAPGKVAAYPGSGGGRTGRQGFWAG